MNRILKGVTWRSLRNLSKSMATSEKETPKSYEVAIIAGILTDKVYMFVLSSYLCMCYTK